MRSALPRIFFIGDCVKEKRKGHKTTHKKKYLKRKKQKRNEPNPEQQKTGQQKSKKNKFMSKTQPGPRSPAWKTCESKNVTKNRKRRAPVGDINQCKQRIPQEDRCRNAFLQTSTECRISAPCAQTPENSVVSSSRQATTRGLAAYKIGSKMGRGNYGVVYKAEHSPTNTLVAIKCLRADPDGEGVPSTTLREISLLRDLNHPNIIGYYPILLYGLGCFIRIVDFRA